MDGRPTWTDCDEAGEYIVPNVLSPRDLVSRPDKMDGTVLHTYLESLARGNKWLRSLAATPIYSKNL